MTLKTIKNTPPPLLLHPQLSIITPARTHGTLTPIDLEKYLAHIDFQSCTIVEGVVATPRLNYRRELKSKNASRRPLHTRERSSLIASNESVSESSMAEAG